ncbi:MAG TPA: UvrD-helicase domain-containing protein, partial [Candidatus Eisenbacteria bacterium]
IHSFCGQVLRERPIEAGITPGFGVADEVTAGTVFDEAWEEWLATELADLHSPLKPVLEAGVGPGHLAALLERMRAHRDALREPDRVLESMAVAEARAEDAWKEFRDAIGRLDAGLDELLATCRKSDDRAHLEMSTARAAVARLANRARGETEVPRHRLLGDLPFGGFKNKGKKENWPDDCLIRLRTLATDATNAHKAWADHHRSMLTLLAVRRLLGALDAYARLKAERSLLDFDDLLLVTRDLLRRDATARRDLAGTWTRLLVDEFQDTDPVQVEIVCLLAAAADAEVAEVLPVAAPGALFVVGDPKQSIYRFRRADIQMYQRTVRAMAESGSAREVITENFRTRPSITAWVNRLFDRLMAEELSGDHQPSYAPLTPFRDEPPGDDGGVIHLAIDGRETDADGATIDRSADERRRQEARGVAAWLKREIGSGNRTIVDREEGVVRPIRWSDAAILFRTSTAVSFYEDALRRAEIPYRVEGGKFYFQRQEVQALLATLRAIDDPGNRVAMVAALRSVLFGFTDDELVLAVEAGLFDAQPRGTPPRGIAAAVAWIRDCHARRHAEGPGRMVEGVLGATQAIELFALRPLGEQRVANLRKIVDEARRFEGHAGGFREFIRFLSEREAALEKERDSPLVDDGDSGAVTLQTMHGSKGLEYGLVVLADLDGQFNTGRDSSYLKRDAEGRVTLGFRLEGLIGGGGTTPGWDELKLDEEQHAAAERIRLFYVAATRARDRLVLPIAARDGKALGFRSLLETANLADLPLVSPPPEDSAEDEPLLRRGWRVPAPMDDGALAATQEVQAARAAHRERLEALRSAWPPSARWFNPSLLGGGGKRATTNGDADADPVGAGPPSDGRPVGRAVHGVLERVAAHGGDRMDRVAQALVAEGITDPDGGARVARFVDAALAHPLWARARAASWSGREVPFLAGWSAEEAGGAARRIDGICDLLFEEGDGLVLVDWKTDRHDADGWEGAARRHRAQLLGYLLAIEAGAPRPVTELNLVFLEDGTTVSITVDDALRAEARRLYLAEGVESPVGPAGSPVGPGGK